MYLTHVVFASLVAAAIAEETGTHTDAWKTVSQNETFYLMYRSYEYDAGTGGTGKCVSVKLCNKNDATRTATSRLMYRDAQTTQLKGFTARVTMARSWNSTVDDIIRLGDADNCDASANAATAEYRLVYSDYSSCDVMVVFGTPEPRCELWIKDGKQNIEDNSRDNDTDNIKNNITKCKKEYDNLCKVKYQIYDRDICSSPMKWPH
ncbi:male-specific histamine-binding salivary protein-like [Ixodes scapularis]|uniref:male-specific histamine-binding salivary protein-like n=1 Tax=Ixodes scapularis TaxID=6945 RepID=UPI001C381379|nr:male-specific histamine-binding salivary protein-like [Ixodes scapularis]